MSYQLYKSKIHGQVVCNKIALDSIPDELRHFLKK